MKKIIWCLCAVAAALNFGCGDDKDKNGGNEQCKGDNCGTVDENGNDVSLNLVSLSSCQLDSDCDEGSFCFHNTCAVQCNGQEDCPAGYLCSSKTGRCVAQSFVMNQRRLRATSVEAEDANDYNLAESANSSVVASVIGQKLNDAGDVVEKISILETVAENVVVDPGQETVEVTLKTTNDLGDVQYIVRSSEGTQKPKLLTASKETIDVNVGGNNVTGYVYTFQIKPSVSNKTENAKGEAVTIDSGAGSFQVALKPRPIAEGIYDGYVTPNSILSGTPLPIRMRLETQPAAPKSISDIESASLWLPVSASDLFSPEPVLNTDKTMWVKVDATKDRGMLVFAFATNDFTLPGGKLFDASHKITRSIRIEFDDYDASTLTFSGNFKDTISNLYRINKLTPQSEVQRTWNQVAMDATLSVKRVSGLADSTMQTAAHNFQSEANSRPLEDAPVTVCQDADIAALAALIPATSDPATCTYEKSVLGEANVDACEQTVGDPEDPACARYLNCKKLVDNYDILKGKVEHLSSISGYNGLQEDDGFSGDQLRDFFTRNAARGILADDNLVSKILTPLLTNSEITADLPAACGQVKTIEDFSRACATAGCDVCKERHEITCAADLIARNYLANKDEPMSVKANRMDTWLKLMRESYLADEYRAWARDTEIREAWLKGGDYSSATFTTSLLSEYNTGLLTSYVTDVLDRQKSVLIKQFTQSTLEMLSQVLNDQTNIGYDDSQARKEMIANRNDILSEMMSTWKAVGEALSLVSRRNDVFLQNDADRLRKAAELRPYLFDLYFAGLIESNLNLAADKGSLNAAYGTVLSHTIEDLKSLDQSTEDKVFMRDGEVLIDTTQADPTAVNSDTMLEVRRQNAEKYVNEAVNDYNKVSSAHLKAMTERLAIIDDFSTALDTYRSQIINLCGIPVECEGNWKTCDFDTIMEYTSPYFCGFNVPLKDEHGAATNGGNLMLETDDVSSSDSSTSQAGSAILAYRQAYNDWLAAKDELDVAEQRVENTGAYLDGYATSIEAWYTARSQVIQNIQSNIDLINSLYEKIGEIDDQIDAAELEEAQNEFNVQKDSLSKWKSLASAKQGIEDATAIAVAAATTAGIWTEYAAEDVSSKGDEVMALAGLSGKPPHVLGIGGIYMGCKTAASTLKAVKAASDTTINYLEMTKDIAVNALDYEMDLNERETSLDIAELQLKLQQNISKLESQKSATEDEITKLKQLNDSLKANNENKEIYERDLNSLKEKRKDYLNDALGLIPLQRAVKVKEIAMYRALIDYLTITQNAQMLATQYQGKRERFEGITNLLYAPETFFAYAADLEGVETSMDRAREAVSDYIAALEYMTVRPYVDLRQANYIARGHRDFKAILDSLTDVYSNCGFGNSQLSNTVVTISLRNRMGIYERDFNDLSPADRFHYAMSTRTLPISMQTRYSVYKSLKDVSNGPQFYAGTFTIDENFANLSGSTCNAKINQIKVRFVSKPGAVIRDANDALPYITVFYGGQSKLVACHDIEALVASIGPRTTFGNVSNFKMKPVAASGNVAIYDLPASEANYVLSSNTDFSNASEIKGFNGYPLMSTYTIMFDPTAGENSKIDWSNVGDIELQLSYTYSNLDANKVCNYR